MLVPRPAGARWPVSLRFLPAVPGSLGGAVPRRSGAPAAQEIPATVGAAKMRAQAPRSLSPVIDPSCRYARASFLRASTLCRCGQPLSAHSPQWPHESAACEGWQQEPKSFTRPSTEQRDGVASSPAGYSPVSEPPQRGGVRRSRPRGEGGATPASEPDGLPGLARAILRGSDDSASSGLGRIAGSVSSGKSDGFFFDQILKEFYDVERITDRKSVV